MPSFVSSLLILGLVAGVSIVAVETVNAQTSGMERRQDRRDDRQDCRQKEGIVGGDKRDCKQEGRATRGDDDTPKPTDTAK
jgi:hypothetical protein